MIELTIADMFLLGWAIIATMYALKYKELHMKADIALHRIITDVNTREMVLRDYARWKSEQNI